MKTNSLWIVGGKIDFLAVKHSLIGGAFFVWTCVLKCGRHEIRRLKNNFI